MVGPTLMLLLLFSCFLFYSSYAVKSSHEAIHLLNFINSTSPLLAEREVRGSRLVKKNSRQSPVYVGPQDGMMAADKIDVLPGQPEGVNFDQYAGYVTVDPVNGRTLFYYFVEAPQDSSSKPLVLWLNGGRWSSSLGVGAMYELGPFRVSSDGKTLTANEAAWNNVANVFFLESPAGTGFSYSNTSSDYETTGDRSTADDNYTFLINWLERFPQYKSRDFFIAGETYAGHYIPELARLILQKNAAKNNPIIQLKGIVMGNALIDYNTYKKALYDYLWSHALMADETYRTIQSSCNFSAYFQTAACNEAINTTFDALRDINLYAIYDPPCRGPPNEKTSVQPDPCGYEYIDKYLNLVEVQKALHVNGHLPYSWSTYRNFNWHDAPVTMIPTIKKLIASGLRVWFYSGDQSYILSVTSTRYAIDRLGLPVELQWKPWSSNDEVGGFVIGYKGLTLATVRGSGIFVPSYQPDRALTMFSAFLKGAF